MATHQFTIEKLQLEFQELNQIYTEIHQIRTQTQEKLKFLNTVYLDLIKINNKKNALFCLDTFYFQYKVLLIEIDNLSRYISLINNRMYGDYYKLYHIIISQLNPEHTQCIDNDSSKKYTGYRDLEPFHEYPILDTQNIHKDIIQNINHIHSVYSSKSDKIQEYNTNKIGLSIDSFINTLEYENNLIDEQIQLYINYVSFFHKTHIEYLYKLLTKIKDFQNEVNENTLSNNDSCQDSQTQEFTIFTIQDFK